MTSRRWDRVSIAFVLLVIVLIFADVLLAGQSVGGPDLIAYHFGMKKAVRDAVMAGDFPLWNRLFEAGQPMAANPAYEVFYPLQWLILLPSFVYGLKLHIVVHYAIAALGMYLLCRTIGAGPFAAAVAALAWGAGGPLMSMGTYLPFLFSLAWLPWMLFFGLRYARGGRWCDLALAAGAFAMQALIGEPVTLMQSAALLIAGGLGLRRMRAAAVIGVAGVLLAAVQLLPAIDHARDSVRSVPFEYSHVRKWSSAPARPLELFIASGPAGDAARFVGPETPFIGRIYIGIVLAAAALAGLLVRRRGWIWAATIAGVSYVVALGEHTPLLRLLYDARLFSSIRYPEKFLFTALFVVIVFGAVTLQDVLDGDERTRRVLLAIAGVVAVVCCVAAIADSPQLVRWTWRLPPITDMRELVSADRNGWLLAGCRAAALLLLMTRIRVPRWQVATLVFTAIDVALASWGVLPRVPDRYYAQPPPLAAQWPDVTHRVFNEAAFEQTITGGPPRIGFDVAAWLIRNEMTFMVPVAWQRAVIAGTDYDETTLVGTLWLRGAAQTARARHDVSWPFAFMAMSNAEWRIVPLAPAVAATRSGGDLERLTPVTIERAPFRAARYLFVRELIPCGDVVGCVDAIRARFSWPAALVPPVIGARRFAPAKVLRVVERPASATLDVMAQAPAFLVMSVTFHKYWHATIDGRRVPIVPANMAYQGLFVPPGRHTIALVYRNPLIPAGAAISFCTLVALLLAGRRATLRRPLS